MAKSKRQVLWNLFLILLPIAAALWCIGCGRYGLKHLDSLEVLWHVLLGGKDAVKSTQYSVVINMRLCRVLLALVCGGGLAAAGAGLQAVFSNPLVSPDTLGVASGASFGAALALLFQANMAVVQISALVFGLLACLLTYSISESKGSRKIVMLLLAGMVVNALFQALVSLIKYVADTESILPSITYWLMGSLYSANFRNLMMGAPMILLAGLGLFLIRWKADVLSLSEEEATALGIPVRKMRLYMIICCSMITASVVSMCGQIGWVGLIIPHLCRMVLGSSNERVIPASLSLGAVFFLLVDTASRSIAITEIPVSILTAIIGAPIFITLLKKTGGV